MQQKEIAFQERARKCGACQTVIQDAHKAQTDVAVCGEMACELQYVMLLLGMGIRTIGLSQPMIREIKQTIRSATMKDCINVGRKVLNLDCERQISRYLNNAARKILPDAF